MCPSTSRQKRHLGCVIGAALGQHVSSDLTGAGVASQRFQTVFVNSSPKEQGAEQGDVSNPSGYGSPHLRMTFVGAIGHLRRPALDAARPHKVLNQENRSLQMAKGGRRFGG